ncbi:glucosaminidase domain-containing protein [Paenibacillus athensensis]|uniref:Mannosyl-glycoprotein endo-beta-N-acetylglucosamidase-like domain-containing protein n=1 Tax=Paenibacillus athensensis TaxID=1967502 RepID=A0A4Y8Q7A7_9BACL|nr:glucosaminidase domain-containing protein [Paenibacillus athensensis]MCD1259784.1 glucosaminidase domain-containing protein [Paenibacillus athensensis]
MTKDEFIGLIAPIAVKLRLEGSPLFASVRVAQALLETGGTVNPWNNLVGYKAGSGQPTAYWSGKRVSASTWEVVQGQTYSDVRGEFRAYDSIEDGFRDQDLLFQSARYAKVRSSATPGEQTQALLAAGYATDPAYAAKLDAVIRNYGLQRYDEEVDSMLEELKAEIASLRAKVTALQHLASLDTVPDWAVDAVQAATAAGLIDTPAGGSYDFYRLLTVLHRKGIV